MKLRIAKWIIILLTLGVCAHAQKPVLSKQLVAKNIKLFKVDELNSVYLIDKKNAITKYNDAGDSLAFFQQITNGPIGAVDASDPLRVLVYYPNFLKIVVLDRMLAPLNTVDLSALGIQQPTAIAASQDGSFWVYDYSQVSLMKIDKQYKKMAQSNNLRVMLNEVPKFELMFETDKELFAYDSNRGLYMFTRFGDFINKLPLQADSEILDIQKIQNQIVYATAKNIYVYNLNDFSVNSMNIGQVIGTAAKSVYLDRSFLYVLNSAGLDIYSVTY